MSVDGRSFRCLLLLPLLSPLVGRRREGGREAGCMQPSSFSSYITLSLVQSLLFLLRSKCLWRRRRRRSVTFFSVTCTLPHTPFPSSLRPDLPPSAFLFLGYTPPLYLTLKCCQDTSLPRREVTQAEKNAHAETSSLPSDSRILSTVQRCMTQALLLLGRT